MRSLSFFVLILGSVTLAAAQGSPYKTPKSKPYHSQSRHSKENQGGAKGVVVVTDKKLTPHVSNSQELHRVEHQTARSSASKKASKHPGNPARVVKTDDEKNLPIKVSSAKEGHASMNKQGKNPYKGRLKQKGNNKH